MTSGRKTKYNKLTYFVFIQIYQGKYQNTAPKSYISTPHMPYKNYRVIYCGHILLQSGLVAVSLQGIGNIFWPYQNERYS